LTDGTPAVGQTNRLGSMLDTFGILFSSVMVLAIIIRAVRLDRTQPWFAQPKPPEKPEPPNTRPWRKRA
jgi:hypothetical protein